MNQSIQPQGPPAEKHAPASLSAAGYCPSRIDAIMGLFLMLIPFLSYRIWQGRHEGQPQPPILEIRSTVNPNTAPWWELAILPNIGPSRAMAIVRYQEAFYAKKRGSSELPFRRIEDLDTIYGIGPKTIAKIQPELRFEN